MHDCQFCGCACYCGFDIDDCDVGDVCSVGCGCDDDGDDGGPVECRCGRIASAEACDQCGAPLCAMCFESGAGFCESHPNADYRPSEGENLLDVPASDREEPR